ncbi:MAG: KH domain-containing protein [Clostridiales bacterium]|nr:KH domain-containing protein [Clostridiales bacterium]
MKELIEVMAKALVDKPTEVRVKEIDSGKSVIYELTVAPEDMGKVIGRQGRIARALRTVVKSAAAKTDKKVIMEIL